MVAKQQWRKVGSAPLFPDLKAGMWDRHPSAPHVVRVGDELRMYYHGREGGPVRADVTPGRIRIGMARASVEDPLSWEKHSGNPILDLGPHGGIDSHWASYPWVVPVTDMHWHMYYAGFGGEYQDEAKTRKIWRTTMAESDDGGLTWERSGSALLPLGWPNAPDADGTGSCSVLRLDDEYWMWYTAVSRPRPDWYRISVALARSTDGGHSFAPHPEGALLNVPPAIGSPGSTCSKPFVERDGDLFRMWFSCAKDRRGYRVHYAESADGIRFKWLQEPVVDVSQRGWDSDMTCYPSVVHLDGRSLLFYVGNGYSAIGVAELLRGSSRLES